MKIYPKASGGLNATVQLLFPCSESLSDSIYFLIL